ncbi:MAG: xylan 1,4-beta-xylosidase [Oscillospiraceae bacterium]|nr:xylan 1,4-beta-xylosidase [Oscillospiraceae bacterium]
MSKEKRFVKLYGQGTMEGCEIWVDRETGVNYLFHFSGYAGGLTPLLDRDGKPLVTPADELENL